MPGLFPALLKRLGQKALHLLFNDVLRDIPHYLIGNLAVLEEQKRRNTPDSVAIWRCAILVHVHFGQLGWTSAQVLEEACALEGHPDNAASVWLGGFITAFAEGRAVHFARVVPPAVWRALVVLPADPLATSKARAVLPPTYSRADAVANVQAATLLGVAFAQGRGDLLRIAMRDRFHQPYRAPMCPLLPPLLPLAGAHGILGVALSGAGPAVLVILDGEASIVPATLAIQDALRGQPQPECKPCSFQIEGAESLARDDR